MATPNYNLPTITGNMTADVVRDVNALAEATDTAIKSAVDGIDLTNIEQEISDVDSRVTAHLAEVASKTKYGHVKIGNGIDVSNGIISVSDMTASNVSIADVANNFESTTVEGALSELFTNVSDGKSLIGGAITDVDPDVIVPAEPTFQDLATAIGSINTGKKWASDYNAPGPPLEVRGLDFRPRTIILEANDSSNRRVVIVYSDELSINFRYNQIGGTAGGSNTTIYDDGFSTTFSSGFSTNVRWLAFE